jgi:hypothetical protein
MTSCDRSDDAVVLELEQDEGCGSDLRDAAGVEADPVQDLESGLSRELARSPTPWMPRMTLLKVCWVSVSSPLAGHAPPDDHAGAVPVPGRGHRKIAKSDWSAGRQLLPGRGVRFHVETSVAPVPATHR